MRKLLRGLFSLKESRSKINDLGKKEYIVNKSGIIRIILLAIHFKIILMKSPDYSFIETCSPRAWKDFLNFYKSEFSSIPFLGNISFQQLPFEMQLGIYLKYFANNGVELDVCNTEYSMLPQNITEAFKNFEKVFSHYS